MGWNSVVSGGLNLKYIDDVVLVPSIEVVPAELLSDLDKLGFTIEELGEEHFNLLFGAGVKCRSFDSRWRNGVDERLSG